MSVQNPFGPGNSTLIANAIQSQSLQNQFTQATFNGWFAGLDSYKQQNSEIAVGITPTNFAYSGPNAGFVNVFRYLSAAQISDVLAGTLTQDCTTAIQNLFTVCQQGYTAYFPVGQYKISGPLTFNGFGAIYMETSASINCTGSGYTAITFGSTTAAILKGCILHLEGNGNTINGILAGTSGSAGHNLEGCVMNMVRVNNFNGYGLQINDCWDSTWEWISIQLCGNGTGANAALSINNLTNTTNQCSFVRIQSEQATTQAIFVDQVLNCLFGTIHAERATGDGTHPTHSLGGAGSFYSNCYLNALSNGLVVLTGSNTEYHNINNTGMSVQFGNGTSGTYGASNTVNGMSCSSLTELVSNVYGWNFTNCIVTGTLTYQSGSGPIRIRFTESTIANVAPTNNGSYALFIDCNITGTWTTTGNPSVDIRGGVCANFPTTATVLLDNVSVTNAYTTSFAQQITAIRCTFSGTITIQNNNVNWRSDGCNFAAVTLGTGAPGFLFGPRDRASGAVSGGLLQSPSAFGASGVAYVLGDKGYNLQSPATGSFAWTCTTAGSPGTFTNLTIP